MSRKACLVNCQENYVFNLCQNGVDQVTFDRFGQLVDQVTFDRFGQLVDQVTFERFGQLARLLKKSRQNKKVPATFRESDLGGFYLPCIAYIKARNTPAIHAIFLMSFVIHVTSMEHH